MRIVQQLAVKKSFSTYVWSKVDSCFLRGSVYEDLRTDLKKIWKNPEKFRKPDAFPEKKYIILFLRSRPSILSRNRVKIAYI